MSIKRCKDGMKPQTTIRIDNDLRGLLWGMVDDEKKTVNTVIWHLKKEYDKNKRGIKMNTKHYKMNRWRSNLKSGDRVKVLRDGYTMPGTVIKSDTIDETTLIRISGQNTPLWHDNHNIFPMYKTKEV